MTQAAQKLINVLGEGRAKKVIAETMTRAGLRSLETPDERYRFACELMTQGGVLEAVGRATKIQALLHGAKET